MSEIQLSINRKRLFSLFRDMMNIYSPSGKEEELTCFIAEFIRSHSLAVNLQTVDETRSNLLIANNNAVMPDILFLGHIDTVPAFDFEHYGFEEHDGQCCGLGAADMKGGCAAMIEAFISSFETGTLPDNVMLALVVGEEETGDGTQTLLEAYRFKHALVAEPTNLRPCLDHYGYVEMLVRAFGCRRHAAMSGRETNAIRAMLRFLLCLEDRVETNEPDTVMNIRDLHSSESGFAVPDRCAVNVDFHIPPGVCSEKYTREMVAFVEHQLLASGASRYETEFPTQTDGYRIRGNEYMPRQLQQVFSLMELEWTPEPFRSHSDANLLRDAGCKPLILGPGLLAKAHSRDESVEARQVVTASQIYTHLLKSF